MKIDAGLMFDAKRAADIAAELEQAGFDGAYSFEGQGDPFTSLILAAPRTTRLELITAVAIAFARNPMTVAQTGWDLQTISDGRFTLGLGTQIKAHIERRYSMPWSHPAARMKEFVQAVRHIWSAWEGGTKLSFEGDFYRHTLTSPIFSPKPNGLPQPPIFVAAVGPLMTQMAGEVADGMFVHPFHTAKSMAELTLPNLEIGAARSERPDRCRISMQLIAASGLDEASLQTAIGAARNQIAFYASTPAYRPVLDVHGWGDLQPLLAGLIREGRWAELKNHIDDTVLETFAVIGSPDQIATQIATRCEGIADRVSPVIHNPDIALFTALGKALRARFPTV